MAAKRTTVDSALTLAKTGDEKADRNFLKLERYLKQAIGDAGLATTAVSAAAVTAHSGLTGLTSGDPHTQYLPVDGSRAMTGDLYHGDRTLVISSAAASHFTSAGAMRSMEITAGFDWYGRMHATAVGDIVVFPLSMRIGDRIKSILYRYYSGGATTKRFSFLISPCTTALPTIQETDTAAPAAGSTSITQTVSPEITIETNKHYFAQFRSGQSGDRIYSIEVTYDHPIP